MAASVLVRYNGVKEMTADPAIPRLTTCLLHPWLIHHRPVICARTANFAVHHPAGGDSGSLALNAAPSGGAPPMAMRATCGRISEFRRGRSA